MPTANPSNRKLRRWLPALIAVLCGATAATTVARAEEKDETSPKHAVGAMFFLDTRIGWIAANDEKQPLLLRTRDGGATWQQAKLPMNVYKLFFLDQNTGWALSGYPHEDLRDRSSNYEIRLFHTTDGGETWREVSHIENPLPKTAPMGVVSDFVFTDPANGLFIAQLGLDGLVMKTSDGGRTLEVVEMPIPPPLLSGIFVGEDKGIWIVGRDVILNSRDQSANWELQLSRQNLDPTFQCRYHECFRFESGWMKPDGRGLVFGFHLAHGVVLRTDDYGKNWSLALKAEKSTDLSGGSFVDESQSCLVGGGSSVMYCTSNAGVTWETHDTLPKLKQNGPPRRLHFGFENIVLLPSGRGWVVTDNHFLYRTEDGGLTWAEVDPIEQAHPKK